MKIHKYTNTPYDTNTAWVNLLQKVKFYRAICFPFTHNMQGVTTLQARGNYMRGITFWNNFFGGSADFEVHFLALKEEIFGIFLSYTVVTTRNTHSGIFSRECRSKNALVTSMVDATWERSMLKCSIYLLILKLGSETRGNRKCLPLCQRVPAPAQLRLPLSWTDYCI